MKRVVFAIDPGPTESAFVVWDGTSLRDFGKLPNNEMLHRLIAAAQGECTELAVERVRGYGMAVGKEVFETCEWGGRFMQAWELLADNPIASWLERRSVKLWLCGTCTAKDKNIRQALIDRVGPQGRKKSQGPTYGVSGDVWAALGVAVTYFDKCELPSQTLANNTD